MTDLETQVRATLARAGERAPSADGLAARVRARRRVRRGVVAWTTGALVAAAVVLIAALPGMVGGTDRPADRAPVTAPTAGWRTVTVALPDGYGDSADVDVPADWVRLDTSACGFEVPTYGLADDDPCAVADRRLAVFGSALYDSSVLPGTILDSTAEGGGGAGWGGYVTVGDLVVSVDTADRAVTRRVLASVRPQGEPAPDVADWSTETVSDEFGEIAVEVPADPRVRVRLEPGLPYCEPGRRPATRRPDGDWSAGMCRDRIVGVDAPTQALADVVAATVRGY